MKKITDLRRLAWAASASIFLLLALGAVVTGTGSGLGCGNHWPSCNGQLIPDLSNLNVVIEFAHRLVAAGVSILVLWTAIWSWRLPQSLAERSLLRSLGAGAVLVLLVQVALGAITVKQDLPPQVVMLHLATGMALFAILVTMAVLLSSRSAANDFRAMRSLKRLHWAALLATLVTYLQIVLGAYVRHSGAALVCPDFPFCQGMIIPPLSGLTLVQFAHRLFALLVALLVIWVAVGAWGQRARQTSPLPLAAIALLLVLLQIVWGALTVLSALNVLWAALHLATAAALLGVLLGVTILTREAPKAVVPAQATPLSQGIVV
jgi:cytochrome c oxidase assembly protein subunit 15